MLNNHSRRRWQSVIVGLTGLLICASCAQQEDYVSFGDELSMVEKYPSSPALPTSQTTFEAELKKLALPWEERAFTKTPGHPATCPDPRSIGRDSATGLVGCLLIQPTASKGTTQGYIAYLDDESRVVMVENLYEFAPP